MKTALFMAIFLLAPILSLSQSGTNAFRFHHVIKQKRLYTVHTNNPCINSRTTTLKSRKQKSWYDLKYVYIETDTCYDKVIKHCPNDTSVIIKSTLQKETIIYPTMNSRKLKCNISLDSKENIIVDFWPISTSSSGVSNTSSITNLTPINPSYFTIPLCRRTSLGTPRTFVKVGFRSWAMGVAVGTFRYRPKQDTVSGTVSGTVSTALSISVTGGYAWGWSAINSKRMTNYSLIAGLFVGLASADLKKGTVENPSEWKTTYDRINPTISYGINTIFSRNNFGIVFSLGFDSNIGPNSKQWIYQNKPWFGIGVNTSLGIF